MSNKARMEQPSCKADLSNNLAYQLVLPPASTMAKVFHVTRMRGILSKSLHIGK
jgi:hypothetical protein